MRGFRILLLSWAIFICVKAEGQEKGKLFFTTGFGLIDPGGKFGQAVRSTLAFNSGVELAFGKDWFGQAVFDFNALRYDQQIKDNSSPYLFRNTNSSLLLLGLNGGKNLQLKGIRSLLSLYAGGGYMNIGEPRIMLDNSSGIASQHAVRQGNVFGRGAGRIAFRTSSAFFQTVYLDLSYWVSPAKVQGGTVNGFSLYLGTRFGTIQ